MKPKDLKAAFSWEERRPLMLDHVFHVPTYYDKHDEYRFSGWSDPDFFGNTRPLCIEYCTGNGAWIVEKAKQFPEKNWIAVEIRYDRVRKIWSKIKNENLSNLIVVCGKAETLTHHYLKTHSIEEVFINFPDPWPKEKHEKHRLMKTDFIDELIRILKPGKKATFVSDDIDYVNATWKLMTQDARFSAYNLLHDMPNYGISWFESLWRKKGKNIHYLQFFTHS